MPTTPKPQPQKIGKLVFVTNNVETAKEKMPVVPKGTVKPVFSNNSNILYKPHSLPSGGRVGSIANGRAVSRKT